MLMAHQAPDDPRNGHRRAPRPMIIEPVDGPPITAWCRTHGQLLVPFRDVVTAMQRYDVLAAKTPVPRPQTIRVVLQRSVASHVSLNSSE
jgi:hypothetical protein